MLEELCLQCKLLYGMTRNQSCFVNELNIQTDNYIHFIRIESYLQILQEPRKI